MFIPYFKTHLLSTYGHPTKIDITEIFFVRGHTLLTWTVFLPTTATTGKWWLTVLLARQYSVMQLLFGGRQDYKSRDLGDLFGQGHWI